MTGIELSKVSDELYGMGFHDNTHIREMVAKLTQLALASKQLILTQNQVIDFHILRQMNFLSQNIDILNRGDKESFETVKKQIESSLDELMTYLRRDCH